MCLPVSVGRNRSAREPRRGASASGQARGSRRSPSARRGAAAQATTFRANDVDRDEAPAGVGAGQAGGRGRAGAPNKKTRTAGAGGRNNTATISPLTPIIYRCQGKKSGHPRGTAGAPGTAREAAPAGRRSRGRRQSKWAGRLRMVRSWTEKPARVGSCCLAVARLREIIGSPRARSCLSLLAAQRTARA